MSLWSAPNLFNRKFCDNATWGENKWKLATFILAILTVTASVLYIYRYEPFSSGLEITDELGGNIFPVTILSTATTDAQLIVPADSTYLGNLSLLIRFLNSFCRNQERNTWFSRM